MKKYGWGLALAALLATSAQAAMQTVDTSDYSFSYDDAFWTGNLSPSGNTFTFTGLNLGASVVGTENGVTTFFGAYPVSPVVKVIAHSGNQIVNIETSALGTASGSGGSTVDASTYSYFYASWAWNTNLGSSATGGKFSKGFDAPGPFAEPFTISGSPLERSDGSPGFLIGTTVAENYLQTEGWVVAVPDGSSAQVSIESISYTVSVSPVPEPASYALLLTGLGLVAGIARRRKQK